MSDYDRYERSRTGDDIETHVHEHHWLPVGIVYVPNGDRSVLGETVPAVAQSCGCGAVQAVVIPGALR